MLPRVSGEFRAGMDPELRFTPSGMAVCSIRSVASARKKNDAGDWVDDKVTWLDVVGFKTQAENMVESIQKGDLFMVNGRLTVEQWESGDKKGTSVSVLVDDIGPSLKFATAKITRAERSESARSGGGGDQWSSPPSGGGDEPPF